MHNEFLSVILYSFKATVDYTVSNKKTCDYIFCNNFNNNCPITIIFWHSQ